MTTIRDILTRYGVSPDCMALDGDVVRLAIALDIFVESNSRAAYDAALETDFDAALREKCERERLAKAPDLADWVAAACRSRLGAPDSFGYGAFQWVGGEEARLSGAVRVDFAVVLDARGTPTRCHTPAELRAALDAIAGGGS